MKKSFSNLCEIQRAVLKSIVESDASNLVYIVAEKPPISTQRRIEIYQDAYQIRMLESLQEDFSRVIQKIGEDQFEEITIQFIQTCPSSYASLAEVSQKFPLFLKNLSEELYELASVDWIEIQSNYASLPNSKNRISIQEIESGKPFQLVQNSTLRFFKGQNNNFIAYCNENETFVREITHPELKVLEIFKNPISPVELENKNIEITSIQSLITDWIKNEIIICQQL